MKYFMIYSFFASLYQICKLFKCFLKFIVNTMIYKDKFKKICYNYFFFICRLKYNVYNASFFQIRSTPSLKLHVPPMCTKFLRTD